MSVTPQHPGELSMWKRDLVGTLGGWRNGDKAAEEEPRARRESLTNSRREPRGSSLASLPEFL